MVPLERLEVLPLCLHGSLLSLLSLEQLLLLLGTGAPQSLEALGMHVHAAEGEEGEGG